jgi:hypothetical protein
VDEKEERTMSNRMSVMAFSTAAFLLLVVAGLGGLPVFAVPSAAAGFLVGSASAQSEVPDEVDIDLNVNEGGRAWYTNPVWIVVGAVILLLIVLIAVMSSRGGGTTVVRG